jgi:hypothetical protein
MELAVNMPEHGPQGFDFRDLAAYKTSSFSSRIRCSRARDAMLVQFILVLVLAQSSACKAKESRHTHAEKKSSELDTQFQFLRRLDGFRVEAFEQKSDLFSSWGFLTLDRRQGSKPGTADEMRRMVLRLGAKAGWKPSDEGAMEIDEGQLAGYGVQAGSPSLDLAQDLKNARGKPATRYTLRIWFKTTSPMIVAAFRVDGS